MAFVAGEATPPHTHTLPPECVRAGCGEARALKAAHGAASGKRGRLRTSCHLFLEAKAEGQACGKPWWPSGVLGRRDCAREAFEPPAIMSCVVWVVLAGMAASVLTVRPAGECGE